MSAYEEAVEAAFGSGFVKRGDVVNLTVRHDDHCALLASGAECSCLPDLYLHRLSDNKTMLVTYDEMQS